MNEQHFSDRLLEERKRLKLNQQEMADLAGVQKRAYNYYEKGERFPDSQALQRLAAGGVDVYFLIVGVRQADVVKGFAVETAKNAVDAVTQVMNELGLQGKLTTEEIRTAVNLAVDHEADVAIVRSFMSTAVKLFRPDISLHATQEPVPLTNTKRVKVK